MFCLWVVELLSPACPGLVYDGGVISGIRVVLKLSAR
jgi:hypothetical protein